jgi:hypothetical protein
MDLQEPDLVFTQRGGAENLERGRFWDIVEGTWWPRLDQQADELRQTLGRLPPTQIAAFQHQFDSLMVEANVWGLRGAAEILIGDCSAEGWLGFRSWLISRGPDAFEDAVENPESLADTDYTVMPVFPEFFQAAPEIYWKKRQCDLPGRSHEVSGTPSGKEWGRDELPILFPRLIAKVGMADPLIAPSKC